MSNALRKVKRGMVPHYTCCRKPMLYMPGKDVYICEKCGKSKKPKERLTRIKRPNTDYEKKEENSNG